jgi:transposase
VAPARIPKKAGDRVTTDRRAAGPLARLARGGALTAVSVPPVADAAIRARRRARDDTIGARKAATWRLTACVRRPALRDTGRAHGSPAHLRWLSAVGCPTPAPHSVLPAEVQAVTEPPERRQRLDQALQEHVQAGRLPPVGAALPARRGGQGPVALTTVAALGALPRGDQPRERMPGLGVLPAESSSGERRQQGALPPAGNPPARRALGAGAWAYRYPATVRQPRPRRLDKHPTALQDIRGKAHVRLCKRSRTLSARGQHANQVVVAMAREVVGCMWAMAQEIPVTPDVQKPERHCPRNSAGCLRAAAETPPRGGGPRDGVKRPLGHTRAEREASTRRRPGRWESTHGEPQAPPSALPGSDSSEAHRAKNLMQTSKNLFTTLDLGRHSNARPELLPEAGAERTLEAVSSRPLFGHAFTSASASTLPQ